MDDLSGQGGFEHANAAAAPSFGEVLSLTRTLCARLCHDMAGPLGGLAGTLEMARDAALDGAQDLEAAELALELAQALSARLRLQRAAWGMEGAAPRPDELLALLPGLPGAERLLLDVAGLGADLTEGLRRLGPSLLLVAAASLPRGGAIRMAGASDALVLSIDGVRAAWPDGLQDCSRSLSSCLAMASDPRNVAVPLACLLADSFGLRIMVRSPTQLDVHAA